MLADEIKDAIDKAVSAALSMVEFRVGTVILSPSYEFGDPLTVQFDGSSVAVPVKMIRAFNVFPNARVVVGRAGSDWFAVGVFIDPLEANIVAGIPDGARFEFDPYEVRARLYDSNSGLVIELDKDEGVRVFDPEGDAGNFTRMLNNSGQMSMSQSPETGYGLGRVVTYKEDEGAANERVRTALEGSYGVAQSNGLHNAHVESLSKRLDDSEGTRLILSAYQDLDDTPQSMIQLFAGVIDLQPWGSDPDRAVTVTDAPLFVGGDIVTASENGVNAPAVTSGSDSTNSATYVNLAGTGSVTSFTFEKRFTDTRIRVQVAAGFFPSAADNAAEFGVRINSVDTTICRRHINPSLVHGQAEGTGYITGVPAGTYTVQGRWRRFAGTGSVQRNPSDWLSITAKEVS